MTLEEMRPILNLVDRVVYLERTGLVAWTREPLNSGGKHELLDLKSVSTHRPNSPND